LVAYGLEENRKIQNDHHKLLSGFREEKNVKISSIFVQNSERKIQNDHHELLSQTSRAILALRGTHLP